MEREKERETKSIVCESANVRPNNSNNQSPFDDDFKFKHNKLRLFSFDCLIMIIGELAEGIYLFVHRCASIGLGRQNQCDGGGKCRRRSFNETTTKHCQSPAATRRANWKFDFNDEISTVAAHAAFLFQCTELHTNQELIVLRFLVFFNKEKRWNWKSK